MFFFNLACAVYDKYMPQSSPHETGQENLLALGRDKCNTVENIPLP